jgi:general secretion pathway protein E
MNTPDRMIITVEDPVEYELGGVSQIQVNHKIDLSFAIALRSILRQNPDVVMVGKQETKKLQRWPFNASLTGHFVLSTLHTNDASSAPTRLIDMGVQPFLIASSLVAVLAQRLIRTLCPNCKEPHAPSEYEMSLLGIESIPSGATIFSQKGCPHCNDTGYDGRTCVAELMMIDDQIKSLILRQADAGTIKKAAVKAGMVTLRQDALSKIFNGITSIEEMMRAINADENIE